MQYGIVFSALGLLLTGCAVTMAPHGPYIPAVRQQGEGEAKLASSVSGKQLELQLGYQLTKRLVLNAGALHYRRPHHGTLFNSGEFGAGYYVISPGERWRFGLHTGLAYGGGKSGADFISQDYDPTYKARYTYAYLQPTVQLQNGSNSWGLGIRLSRVRYHLLNETIREETPTGTNILLIDRSGHQSVFLQPAVQFDHRVRRWLNFSGSFGAQIPLVERDYLTLMNPFITQLSAHFIMGRRPAP